MNQYKFVVMVCGGYCEGMITVKANNQEEASDKAMESFNTRWVKAFPELECEFNCELEKVVIDKKEIERKLKLAKELCGGEDLEINNCNGEVRALRYLERRGSAEWIDGMEEVLWYEEDADMDDDFDPQDLIDKYADAVCM